MKSLSHCLLLLMALWTFPLCAQTFSASPNIDIPDNSCPTGTNTPLAVSGVSGSLGSMVTLDSVCVNVDHAWVGDVTLELIHPNGSASSTLVSSFFNSGDNYVETCFKTNANETIQTAASGGASAPFTGAFLPESPFSAFNTLSPNGTWTMRVCDNTPMNSGSLLNWRLIFSGAGMGCDVDLDIPGTPSSGTYQASNSIMSDAKIEAGRNVIYRAGNTIMLNFPFEVELNAAFSGEIGACN